MDSISDILGVGGWVLLALVASGLVAIGVRVLGDRRSDRKLDRAINKVSRF